MSQRTIEDVEGALTSARGVLESVQVVQLALSFIDQLRYDRIELI